MSTICRVLELDHVPVVVHVIYIDEADTIHVIAGDHVISKCPTKLKGDCDEFSRWNLKQFFDNVCKRVVNLRDAEEIVQRMATEVSRLCEATALKNAAAELLYAMWSGDPVRIADTHECLKASIQTFNAQYE